MTDPIICTPIGVFPGYQRLGDSDLPAVKSWRCELTALSQLYNLYFLACNDEILVYQLRFPDQSPEDEPDFVLCPPVSSTNLDHGIDAMDPHSITRLLVDYLGHDEILLVACDDGDVVGYRVDEIMKAIERQGPSPLGDTTFTHGERVRVFLHRNVGKSAWGLAIHREARLIAISANTHIVTVLAYALANGDNESIHSWSSSSQEKVAEESSPDYPSPRNKDHIITLSAGANIPAVSFNNNGCDPSGRWLFCSCIDGKNMLWDLHNPQEAARVFQVGFCSSANSPMQAPRVDRGECLCLRPDNVPHGAWHSSFLDVRAAIEVPLSNDDAVKDRKEIFKDVTGQKLQFMVTPYEVNIITLTPPNVADDTDVDMGLTESDSEAEDDDQSQIGDMDQNGSGDVTSDGAETISVDSDNNLVNNPNGSQPVSNAQNPNGPTATAPAAQVSFNPAFPLTWTMNVAGGLNGLMDATEPPPQAQTPIFPPKFFGQIDTSPSFQQISDKHPDPGPCILITKEEIFLIQNTIDPAEDYKEPILCMSQPLHPRAWVSQLNSPDRHCFFKQIPELGLFIIASPVGRAGIFSITKSPHPVPSAKRKFTYGFRLEYILPFKKAQTKTIWQPGGRLLGIAAGPMQGMFDKAGESDNATIGLEERRWRLILYYTDHTMLSFELSKRRTCSTPNLDELMV